MLRVPFKTSVNFFSLVEVVGALQSAALFFFGVAFLQIISRSLLGLHEMVADFSGRLSLSNTGIALLCIPLEISLKYLLLFCILAMLGITALLSSRHVIIIFGIFNSLLFFYFCSIVYVVGVPTFY